MDNSVNEIQTMADVETETTDEFCDTTKIKDFKSNLTILTQELTDKEREYCLNPLNSWTKLKK